ncbi:xylulokinase [Sciscionella marina]|uniref:xylulokinase n=1 Tax=Sciscionella marina TaxID=508770 RepID=UPI00035E8181|nr:xylulokinase [Sciscionella marina]
MTELVAGVDSSTQSTKIVVCDAGTGAVVREASAPHPPGTECPPDAWLTAFEQAADGLLDGVRALAVAGQQHGMVAVDEQGAVVRDALLWNDTRSAQAAAELIAELGGPPRWVEAIGSVPPVSFTITKLRWLAEHEPANARRVAGVMLPHDWLTWRLGDGRQCPATDRGDASGTGYFAPWQQDYRTDLVKRAFGSVPELPRIAAPNEPVGETPDGILLAPGTGDNMGAALGMDLAEGEVVVSVGTSGTVFAVGSEPSGDPGGFVAGFADAAGGYLPLVCTLNAARVLDATAGLLRADRAEFDELALGAEPGAGGMTLLPYLDGERTPNRPDASGMFAGLTTANAGPGNLARAAVEGMLCGLADGIEPLREQGITPERLLLIGGGAASEAVRRIAPSVFGLPVTVPRPAQYVALGAARQAAWTLSGAECPPQWDVREPAATFTGKSESVIRENYARIKNLG